MPEKIEDTEYVFKFKVIDQDLSTGSWRGELAITFDVDNATVGRLLDAADKAIETAYQVVLRKACRCDVCQEHLLRMIGAHEALKGPIVKKGNMR